MTQQQPDFQGLLLAMANPQQRAQTIQTIPTQLQPLFQDHNKRFEIIGQDGTQALIDWQNSIVMGQPMPESSQKTLDALYTKLMGMVNAGQAVATI